MKTTTVGNNVKVTTDNTGTTVINSKVASPKASEDEVNRVAKEQAKVNEPEPGANRSQSTAKADYAAEVKQSEANREAALAAAEAAEKARSPEVEETARTAGPLDAANATLRQSLIAGPDSAPDVSTAHLKKYILALAQRLETGSRQSADVLGVVDEVVKEMRRIAS